MKMDFPNVTLAPKHDPPVLLSRELHIGLVLPLLVLQGAIQQQDAGVGYSAPHAPRRDNVLLEHYALEYSAVLYCTAWKLLDLGVLLDINFALPLVCYSDGSHGIQCQLLWVAAASQGVSGAINLGRRTCCSSALWQGEGLSRQAGLSIDLQKCYE